MACFVFKAASLYPLVSNRERMLPTRPRWTPSGLICYCSVKKVSEPKNCIGYRSFLSINNMMKRRRKTNNISTIYKNVRTTEMEIFKISQRY